MVLPEWNGNVVSACHRCGISRDELAEASGVSRPYLSKVLNSLNPPELSKAKIEIGLRSCVEKRDVRFKYMFPVREKGGGHEIHRRNKKQEGGMEVSGDVQ